MSTDLFKDNPSVFEHPKVKDDEQIVSALTEEFNQLFKREGLEQNLQIVSKMSSSLELPITSIYKDKAVLAISNNLALIREGLSRSTSVEYDSDRGIIRPKFKALRNKIVVNKIPDQLKQNFLQLVTGSQEYAEKISEKYLDNIKSFNISVITEESANSLFEKIKSFFESNKTSIEVHLEYEDLYLNIFQKAQESYKRQVYSQDSSSSESPTRPNQFYQYAMPNPYGYRNTPYYGYNSYGNYGGYPGYSPGYYGPNANTYSGPGSNQLFIRKAQDENYEEQQEEYNGGGRYGGGRRRDKNGRRNQGERRVKNEEKKERKVISEADINDVEKFPPLLSQPSNETAANDMFSPSKKKSEKIEQVSQEEAKKVEEKKFIKIKPKAMIEEFKNLGEHVKPDTKLAGMDSTLIPVLNLGIKPDLEAINPTPPKDVKETPKLNPMTPKQSFKAN